MRPAIYVAALIACAAAAPDWTRAALASAASVILESLPYLALSEVLRAVLGRFASRAAALLTCGCGSGPSARSIPATVAAWLLVSPWVALARFGTALVIARFVPARCHAHESLTQQLAALFPVALLCGGIVASAANVPLAHLSPVAQFLGGAMLGFGTPCALGGITLAAGLRGQSLLAAAGLLCTSGIIDVSVWRSSSKDDGEDAVVCVLVALVCALVAYERGAALIHPAIALALWPCAVLFGINARKTNTALSLKGVRIAATLLALTVLAGSPPPALVATESTIDGAYAGEPIDFTGRYDIEGGRPQLVRYAITCCRADARPVMIPLDLPIDAQRGSWVQARGTLRAAGAGLALHARTIARIAPPSDPFIYR